MPEIALKSSGAHVDCKCERANYRKHKDKVHIWIITSRKKKIHQVNWEYCVKVRFIPWWQYTQQQQILHMHNTNLV